MPYREGYVSVAQYLYNAASATPQDEAKWRSSMSRAYFGVFNMAKDKLSNEFCFSRKSTDHQNFITYLRKHADPHRKKIGDNLDILRTKRNEADYGDRLGNVANNTQLLLELAENTKDLIKAL